MSRTTSFYAGAGDGGVRNTLATWALTHDAATGTSVESAVASFNMEVEANVGGTVFVIERAYFPFDTSTLGVNVIVKSATVNVDTTVGASNNDAYAYVSIVATTQASNTTLVVADFNKMASTKLCTADLPIGVTLGSGYKVWTLNAAGIGMVNRGGFTKFGLREGHDLENVTIPNNKDNYVTWYCSEQSGTTHDPYLSVTYSYRTRSPGGGAAYSGGGSMY